MRDPRGVATGRSRSRARLSEIGRFCENRRGGYARVSTTDQQPHLQVDALDRAGCYRVFVETASGAVADRPVLKQVLDQLHPSDTLVVWKLDRLGRSLGHLVDTVTVLADGAEPRWSACTPPKDDTFANLRLRGPHDLRHTFSTWLKGASIPGRVIDELMGHSGGATALQTAAQSASATGTRPRRWRPALSRRSRND